MSYSSLLCPEALPTERALCQHLMWSDQVILMWPDFEPPGFTQEQAKMRATIDELQGMSGAANQPLVYVDRPTAQVLERAKPLLSDWTSDASSDAPFSVSGNRRLEEGTAIDSPDAQMSDPHVEGYLWPGKVPDEVLAPYVSGGLLQRTRTSGGQVHFKATAKARGLVPHLLTALAGATALELGKNTSLVFTNNQVLKSAVLARSQDTAILGTMLSLPTLPLVRPDITVAEIQDELTKPKFIDARAEYLHTLATLKERTTGVAQALDDVNEYFAEYAKEMAQAHEHVSKLTIRLKTLAKRLIGETSPDDVATLIADASDLVASPSALVAFQSALDLFQMSLQMMPVILDWRGPQFLRYARGYLQPG